MSHTRNTITLVVLVAVFVGGIVVGYRLLTAPVPDLELESGETSEKTCKDITIRPGNELAREQVTVDVYNAGSQSGLASTTQRRLSRYDYQRGAIGNADEIGVNARNVTIVAENRTGAFARLLERQFRGKVRVIEGDVPKTSSVIVVLGENFVGLNRKAPATVPVRKKLNVCVPIESNPAGND